MGMLLPKLTLSIALFGNGAFASADEIAASPKELLAQAEKIELKDPEAAAALARKAISGLQKPEDAALNRDAKAHLCMIITMIDPAAAIPLAEQGLKLSRAANDLKTEAKMWRCQGYAQELSGDTEAAAQAYELGVLAAEKSNDKEALAEVLVLRGEGRYYHGQYDEAIADLKRSYDLSTALGNQGDRSYALNAIANLYADANVGEYDKAIDYYRQLLKSHEARGLKSEIATARFNLGSTFERKGDFDAALDEYTKAYEIDSRLGDPASLADEQRVIGAVLTKQNKATEALPWIEKAITYFQVVKDIDGVARVQLTRGITFRKLGRIKDSLADLEASQKYFEAEKNLRYLAKIHEERALTFAAGGDWRNAYEAGNDFRAAQQQLDKGLLEERTSRLRVQFDAVRKEQENRVLQIESAARDEALKNANKMNRLQWQVIVLGAAMLALLAVLAARQLYKARRMRILAMTDELTKLPNRRHILTFLGDQAKLSYEDEQPISIIVFDIDHFKAVNDKYAHEGGDIALIAVANIANQALRRGDRVGRIGGEEFLVVLPGTEHRSAMEIAERLRRSVEVSEFDESLSGLRLTISLGVSEWKAGRESIEVLLKRADGALYEAKNAGRNRSVEKL
jgi:diguanylate cyclase (GGDEF)-like protein